MQEWHKKQKKEEYLINNFIVVDRIFPSEVKFGGFDSFYSEQDRHFGYRKHATIVDRMVNFIHHDLVEPWRRTE